MAKSKNACGGDCDCGGDKDRDPYQESLEAVWHDPTSYDALKHGPSYMPKSASQVVTASQKAEARKVAVQQVNPKVAHSLFPELPPLPALLALLRASSMIHQTHHWQTNGGHYYADHLLFERLYDESQDFIDQVAERAVGTSVPGVVDVHAQAKVIEFIVGHLCNGSTDPDEMVNISLRTESLLVQAVDLTIQKLEADGELSNGTDNLLQGISDLHEGFIYLLKQRATPPKPYHYGR
jgi:DNA-binding ferritin-like protein